MNVHHRVGEFVLNRIRLNNRSARARRSIGKKLTDTSLTRFMHSPSEACQIIAKRAGDNLAARFRPTELRRPSGNSQNIVGLDWHCRFNNCRIVTKLLKCIDCFVKICASCFGSHIRSICKIKSTLRIRFISSHRSFELAKCFLFVVSMISGDSQNRRDKKAVPLPRFGIQKPVWAPSIFLLEPARGRKLKWKIGHSSDDPFEQWIVLNFFKIRIRLGVLSKRPSLANRKRDRFSCLTGISFLSVTPGSPVCQRWLLRVLFH